MARFGELAIRTSPSSIDEDDINYNDDVPNGFSTIDLNTGAAGIADGDSNSDIQSPTNSSFEARSNSFKLNSNHHDSQSGIFNNDTFSTSSHSMNGLGYTSFGEALNNSNRLANTNLPPYNQSNVANNPAESNSSPKHVTNNNNINNNINPNPSNTNSNNNVNSSNTNNIVSNLSNNSIISSLLSTNLSNVSATSVLSSASEASTKLAIKTVSTIETLRLWSKSAYKCTRQIVSEKLGKTSRTVDPELDAAIDNLRDIKKKYENILVLSRSLAVHFKNMVQTQKSLGEAFADLSQKSSELIDEFTSNAETQRQLVRQGDILMSALNSFTSNLQTLCNKTIEDTLITIRNYEAARLEYDAYRFDLETLKSNPNQNEQKAQEIRNLDNELNLFKEKYDKFKQDVSIKLKFLDENRVQVMRKQLILFQNAIGAYFTGNSQALESTIKQFNLKISSPPPSNGADSKFQSFLEQSQ